MTLVSFVQSESFTNYREVYTSDGGDTDCGIVVCLNIGALEDSKRKHAENKTNRNLEDNNFDLNFLKFPVM